jgi:hypothetical protein
VELGSGQDDATPLMTPIRSIDPESGKFQGYRLQQGNDDIGDQSIWEQHVIGTSYFVIVLKPRTATGRE